MIKKIVFAAFCIAQASLVNAAEKTSVTISTSTLSNEILPFQKIPKTVILKTKKFKIRIDKQPNGKYLYQSWAANAKITSKPSMIISDGELIPDGTGGNYYFSFVNEGYSYQVWRNYLTDYGTKSPYTLKVNDENDHEIVRQDAFVVKQ
ncbi:hypothetical protein [Chryseobacterium vrystaatense]|uniref:Bulb-type lectin domain-containing protein n=1 Tax=Chryseobacterium vrystaatense TaxID=307480 RepID=A0ABR4UFL2_9FLAO|nr:hypothetical protein [Chryseobacterium vrystaatense]KFF23314.1 hypothetical protein IW16_23815 [Chryseobacterium vrystaatense]